MVRKIKIKEFRWLGIDNEDIALSNATVEMEH